MDKELLSFVIETLLLKPQSFVGMTVAAPGYPVAHQSSDHDVVREHAGEMRDLLAERVASNAGVIADTLVEVIKCNARIRPDIIFELCDGVVTQYQYVLTNQVTSIDPKLAGALKVILAYCNYSFTPLVQNTCGNASMIQQQPMQQPTHNQSKDAPWTYNDAVIPYSQLQGFTTNLKISVEEFIQAMLSTKVYSPLTVLRNCNSKVVIVHDSPYKDEIRAIADEKNMIVLTDTSDTAMESESILPYSNHFRPELGLLLMINAYNLTGGARLFPGRNKNSVYAVHEWTSIDNYVALEKYINDTDGIRAELERKAPEFLKDFDEDLAVIHRDWVNN